MTRALTRRTSKALALFVPPDPAPEERRPSHASLRLDAKLPEGPVHLDFEIRGDLPGAEAEWQARSDWLGHVGAHARALAALAVDRTEGETRERAVLVAERLGALLQRGHATRRNAVKRLDLAAPLPDVKPWPPVYAGEPASGAARLIMSHALNWCNAWALAEWRRQIAYYASGMVGYPAQPAQVGAAMVLRGLLAAAVQGLADEERYAAVRPAAPAPPAVSRKRKAGKRGGA